MDKVFSVFSLANIGIWWFGSSWEGKITSNLADSNSGLITNSGCDSEQAGMLKSMKNDSLCLCPDDWKAKRTKRESYVIAATNAKEANSCCQPEIDLCMQKGRSETVGRRKAQHGVRKLYVSIIEVSECVKILASDKMSVFNAKQNYTYIVATHAGKMTINRLVQHCLVRVNHTSCIKTFCC